MDLPAGHTLVQLDEVVSTNAEALSRAATGEPGGLWVMARAQAGGRGRGGRVWASPPGNLYASLLLRPSCPLATVQQLTLLAPVALFDAVSALLKDTGRSVPQLRLKWPNDLLVGGAKVSGILLESVMAPHATKVAAPGPAGWAVVLGFGLNLASHPAGLDQAATHLHAHGCTADPDAALMRLAHSLQLWLDRWQQGAGFSTIRAAWLERAGPLGEALSVRASSDPATPRLTGTFAGLAPDGALLLNHADGSQSRHIQGDVALEAADR